MGKWVFFDIGDVLFDEDAQHQWLFHTLLQTLRAHGKDVRWDDFDTARKALAAKGPDPEAAIKATLAFYCIQESETEALWQESRQRYQEMRNPRPYGFLLDGITAVLEDLKQDFHLGIIANQHPQIMDALENYGVATLFDSIVISETVNLFKPAPEIFQYALDKAQIAAEEAIFVGDRPDNDIAPAKALGMKTVRFRRGIQYVYYNPEEPAMLADVQVEDVAHLAAGVRQAAARETSAQ